MPATAGRVRMPANNRVHSSAALQTHGIWQSAIGYDPYAPNKEDKDSSQNQLNAEPDAENAYASFQGLLQLAKITNADVDISRGACKKCGRVGHLKFQCKNYVKIKDDKEEKDPEAMQPLGLVGMDKLKGKAEKVNRRNNVESSEEEEEDDSESSDSEIDSEIERIVAERSGKKVSGKGGSYRKKGDSDDDGSDKDSGKKRKNRGRSKKRSAKREVSDSDDSSERRRRKKRREHRRKRDKSPDDSDEHRHGRRKSRKEKRRRRSRLSDSDSETSEDSTVRHKRKSKRRTSSSTDTDSSGYDYSRMGRDVKKSGKRRRRHHGDDE